MKKQDVSSAVIRRLPRYYRYLQTLSRDGIERISSSALAERMGLTASQVRQDFNCFGGFGQQGFGYSIPVLLERFSEILGLNNLYDAILIGVGNLGRALLLNFHFEKRGVRLTAAFDINKDTIGQTYEQVTVQSIQNLSAFIAENKPKIAILTVPKNAVDSIVATLKDAGIAGIWNFTSIDLHLNTQDILVENVHFGDTLTTLAYRIEQEKR